MIRLRGHVRCQSRFVVLVAHQCVKHISDINNEDARFRQANDADEIKKKKKDQNHIRGEFNLFRSTLSCRERVSGRGDGEQLMEWRRREDALRDERMIPSVRMSYGGGRDADLLQLNVEVVYGNT